jgi:hypothetical protein
MSSDHYLFRHYFLLNTEKAGGKNLGVLRINTYQNFSCVLHNMSEEQPQFSI